MKAVALTGAFASLAVAIPLGVVDTRYPYLGPAVPIGDWVDDTINGNGKGFNRIVVPPAVKPSSTNATNNINVIQLSYVPEGINIHYSTPFGLGASPSVKYGTSSSNLTKCATGYTNTYDRTPPCSEVKAVTMCNQYFHEVQITGLKADTTYYYKIESANGTTASDVRTFKTGRAAGASGSFEVALVNDMGFTNAHGTHQQLSAAVQSGAAFVWHGGDISYADDWYSGILPCQSDWPVCYNGSHTSLPGGVITPEYQQPLPAGEIPNQGGPQGGDASTLYETNWDIWQQWMSANISGIIPYMTVPGNHEAACAEFDGPNNELTAYLDMDMANGTAANSTLTYYSCPPSQRNFTAYQNRFRMPGSETKGQSNFWYSFDYGLAHFVSFTGETDYYQSPEEPFVSDLSGNETMPTEAETYITDSGPFGYINGSYKDNKNYEQYQWLKADLAAVNRTKTPWVFTMNHRPMYSTEVSSYQKHMRNAWEELFLSYNVDANFAGHIHWYERIVPMGFNFTMDTAAIVNNHTYMLNNSSMVHIVNGQAGNIESHSERTADEPILALTEVLNTVDYGFTRLTVHNKSSTLIEFVRGSDGSVGDYVQLIKS